MEKFNRLSIEKFREIYTTFFDPNSETCIDDMDLWEEIIFSGAISKEAARDMRYQFEDIGGLIWNTIEESDKQRLKERQNG